MIDLMHELIYVLLSGFTEFLPVSARPHQILYETMTGAQVPDPTLSLAIHLGVLLAVFLTCKKQIDRLLREDRHERYSRRHRNRHIDQIALLDMKVLKTAAIPLLLSLLFYRRGQAWVTGPALLAIMLSLNGLLLFFPRMTARGNKDSRSLSRLDSILMGIGGALSVIPGFSRVGGTISAGLLRGCDRDHALDLALMLSIPYLIGVSIIDLYIVIVAKAVISPLSLLVDLLMVAFAFGGGYLGIMTLRYFSLKSDIHSFSYYSWGMALFSFVLYLIVV